MSVAIGNRRHLGRYESSGAKTDFVADGLLRLAETPFSVTAR
jgi:hypothetical protein